MVQMALQEVLCNGMRKDNRETNSSQNESPNYEKTNDNREAADGIEKEEKIEIDKESDTISVLPSLFTEDNELVREVKVKDMDTVSLTNDNSSLLDETIDTYNLPISTMAHHKESNVSNICIATEVKETNLEHDCLLHPTHQTLLNKLEASKNTIFRLEETVTKLEKELIKESSKTEKLTQLDLVISQYEKEIQLSKQEHEIEQRTIASLKKEMETKLAAMKKQYETANKEKENIVMRYAVSEKELLDCKKEKDNLDKKFKDILKENESSQAKLKILSSEKIKISQLLENKVSETSNAYKEIDKLKEEMNSRDIKIKWTQNKLKSEIEGHKECPSVIETLNSNNKQLKKELELCKEELNRLNLKLEQEKNLKEQQAKIIADNPELREFLAVHNSILTEHQILTNEQSLINSQVQAVQQFCESIDSTSINEEDVKDSNNLSKKEVLSSLLREANEIGIEVINLRMENEQVLSQISELYSKGVKFLNLSPQILEFKIQHIQSTSKGDKNLKELESSNGENNIVMPQLISRIHYLEHQLAQEKKNKEESIKNDTRIEQILGEVANLRLTNEELMTDIALFKDREAELLAFTEKLTTKNVKLQSDYTSVESKANELEIIEKNHAAIESQMKQDVEVLKRNLTDEKGRRQEETRLLARQVAEKTTKVEHLLEDITTLQSELSLVKNKHTVQVKELQRELSQYRRKLEQLETNAVGNMVGSATNSLTSCSKSTTSSTSSLNESPVLQGIDVPAQILVERIVKLQQESAKQNDRIEFLEEHSTQLVRELQKKSRLLQNYIMREQTGTLTSNQMDRSKAELSKTGGIMAALYGSKPAEETMTFELSLEINRKLQAVLEDTLLKNITLKENIDTLGDEIARLTQKRS